MTSSIYPQLFKFVSKDSLHNTTALPPDMVTYSSYPTEKFPIRVILNTVTCSLLIFSISQPHPTYAFMCICRGVRFVMACTSNLATATQLPISELLLSHSTGGLYVQSGDNINSQDDNTEIEI